MGDLGLLLGALGSALEGCGPSREGLEEVLWPSCILLGSLGTVLEAILRPMNDKSRTRSQKLDIGFFCRLWLQNDVQLKSAPKIKNMQYLLTTLGPVLDRCWCDLGPHLGTKAYQTYWKFKVCVQICIFENKSLQATLSDNLGPISGAQRSPTGAPNRSRTWPKLNRAQNRSDHMIEQLTTQGSMACFEDGHAPPGGKSIPHQTNNCPKSSTRKGHTPGEVNIHTNR